MNSEPVQLGFYLYQFNQENFWKAGMGPTSSIVIKFPTGMSSTSLLVIKFGPIQQGSKFEY